MEGRAMHQARALFDSPKSPASLQDLIGTNETLHLEVKEGRGPLSDDLQGYLSQALSGFANSDRGVLVLGLTAKRGDKGQPDQITGVKAFEGFQVAYSDIQSLIGQAVMPIVEGVEVISFPSDRASEYGYVITYIPPSDSGPHRAIVKRIGEREYWKRAGDGFYRMEHFDIADMFGRRRRPRVRLAWRVDRREQMSVQGQHWLTFSIVLSLKNDGRAIARYPMLRLEPPADITLDDSGLDGNGNEGLPRGPRVPSERTIIYLGREGHIGHPGVNLDVTRTKLFQCSDVDALSGRSNVFYKEYVFKFGIAAEDQPFEEGNLIIKGDELLQSVQRLFHLNPAPRGPREAES
jgi:schlafen family protein